MAKGQILGVYYGISIGIIVHHQGAARMVLVTKVAVTGCVFSNAPALGKKYTLFPRHFQPQIEILICSGVCKSFHKLCKSFHKVRNTFHKS
jgi:hypothetical protein